MLLSYPHAKALTGLKIVFNFTRFAVQCLTAVFLSGPSCDTYHIFYHILNR